MDRQGRKKKKNKTLCTDWCENIDNLYINNNNNNNNKLITMIKIIIQIIMSIPSS